MPDKSEGERVQKVLARLGYGSRRQCESMILEGFVEVNGVKCRLGDRFITGVDDLRIKGELVDTSFDRVYYLVNKPKGVVCTSSDPFNRPTVVDLVPPTPRVFSVGRLDADSEGLIILTNDGELAQTLTHPSMGVEKVYLVEVARSPSDAALRRLRLGVELEDGMTSPAKVVKVEPNVLKVSIHEGRNRQIRRMCDLVGSPVKRLIRIRIGNLSDRSLRPGEYRTLDASEIVQLRHCGADRV